VIFLAAYENQFDCERASRTIGRPEWKQLLKSHRFNDASSIIGIGMKETVKQVKKECARKSSPRRWVFGIVLFIALAVGIGLAIGLPLRSNTKNDADYSSRTSWPELVGMDADEAVKWLLEHYPNLKVYVLEYGDVYTTEYDVTRVRIFTAPNTTTVIVPPKLGR
jgi:Potato inhibitor I family